MPNNQYSSATTSIAWTGTTGSGTITANLLSEPSIDVSGEAFPSAGGYDHQRGTRVTGSFVVRDWSEMAALITEVETSELIALTWTAITTGTVALTDTRLRITPQHTGIIKEVFLGTSAATGDPTSGGTGWTSCGQPVDGGSISITETGPDDALGRPLHALWQISTEFMVPFVAYSALSANFGETITAADLQLACVDAGGVVHYFDNLTVQINPAPNFGDPNGLQHLIIINTGASDALANLATVTSPDDFFNSFQVDFVGFGFAHADVYANSDTGP